MTTRTPQETPMDSLPETDLLYVAWSIIANARDWLLDDKQAHEWVEAAKRWRDDYHATLAVPGAEEDQ